MEGLNLVSTFAEFKELKNIDRPTMMSVLEDIFRTQLARMYGSADNFDIIINIDKGDFKNSPQRYIIELSHLDNLIKVADENGMPEVADKYRAKKGTVVAEFEKLGFEYKG